MNKPKLTIVVFYNNDDVGMKMTLKSLVRQTNRDFRILVGCDGALQKKMNLDAIIPMLDGEDNLLRPREIMKHIRFIYLEKTEDVGLLWNMAISYTKAAAQASREVPPEYITYTMAGTVKSPLFVEEMMKRIERAEKPIGIAVCQHEAEDGTLYSEKCEEKKLSFEQFVIHTDVIRYEPWALLPEPLCTMTTVERWFSSPDYEDLGNRVERFGNIYTLTVPLLFSSRGQAAITMIGEESVDEMLRKPDGDTGAAVDGAGTAPPTKPNTD